MIRKTTLWALRALLYLADQRPEHLALASEVAAATGAPTTTVGKVLQRLCLAGMVMSQRGIGGGYLLAQPPESIGITAVLRALDDPLVGGHQAEGTVPYPGLTILLDDLKGQTLDSIGDRTIADLRATLSPDGHRPTCT